MTAMRAPLTLLALAGFALAQEPAKTKSVPCDAAAIEDGLWCAKCKKVRENEEIVEEKCKVCRTAPEKVKACVKKWIPRCGMHNQVPHLEACCKSKTCCKFETVKSPVTFICQGCGKSGRTEEAIAHDEKTHEKKIAKKCEFSGTQPHGGEPIK